MWAGYPVTDSSVARRCHVCRWPKDGSITLDVLFAVMLLPSILTAIIPKGEMEQVTAPKVNYVVAAGSLEIL